MLAEIRSKVQEKQRQVLDLRDAIDAAESATRKMQLMDELDKVNDDYSIFSSGCRRSRTPTTKLSGRPSATLSSCEG